MARPPKNQTPKLTRWFTFAFFPVGTVEGQQEHETLPTPLSIDRAYRWATATRRRWSTRSGRADTARTLATRLAASSRRIRQQALGWQRLCGRMLSGSRRQKKVGTVSAAATPNRVDARSLSARLSGN